MTTTARYHQLTTQRAYARRIAAFGLPALLAPYTLREPTRFRPSGVGRLLLRGLAHDAPRRE